jgi:asparagine synthase (glutamine-hydrolysing)
MPWIERMGPVTGSPSGAVDALVQACQRYAEGDVVVSMSAGFDSRLLLACLLSAGIKPRLITMGAPSSTDARVSEAIARQFGLRIDIVPLQAENYFASAQAIMRLTSGAKTFQHWHTYAYAKNAPLNSDSRIFIGSNGEAARSYYLDKGIAGWIADRIPGHALLHKFWSMKLRPLVSGADLAMLQPEFAAQLSEAGLVKRRERIVSLARGGGLLESLDRFYTEQRVAHFITNGLALVNANATPAVPMLERAWMSQVWSLPRGWKMDSKWHRYAIRQLCPQLLEFPEEKTGLPMRGSSRPLYWLPSRSPARSIPYMDYEQLFRGAAVSQLIADSAELIEPVAQPAFVRQVFARHREGENLSRLASFLLTMLYLCRSLREAEIDQRGLAASTMRV